MHASLMFVLISCSFVKETFKEFSLKQLTVAAWTVETSGFVVISGIIVSNIILSSSSLAWKVICCSASLFHVASVTVGDPSAVPQTWPTEIVLS